MLNRLKSMRGVFLFATVVGSGLTALSIYLNFPQLITDLFVILAAVGSLFLLISAIGFLIEDP